jgi:hypothetical protein
MAAIKECTDLVGGNDVPKTSSNFHGFWTHVEIQTEGVHASISQEGGGALDSGSTLIGEDKLQKQKAVHREVVLRVGNSCLFII